MNWTRMPPAVTPASLRLSQQENVTDPVCVKVSVSAYES